MEYNYWKEVVKRWFGTVTLIFICSLIWPTVFTLTSATLLIIIPICMLAEWAFGKKT